MIPSKTMWAAITGLVFSLSLELFMWSSHKWALSSHDPHAPVLHDVLFGSLASLGFIIAVGIIFAVLTHITKDDKPKV